MLSLNKRKRDPRYAYCLVTNNQLTSIIGHQLRLFSPRFFGSKDFIVILNLTRADEMVSNRSMWKSKIKHLSLLRFLIRSPLLSCYTNLHIAKCDQIIIPGADITKLNDSIVGNIECIKEYKLS